MSINKTKKKKQDIDFFDDDFEVIYEGDLPDIHIDEEDDDYRDVLSNLSELDHTKRIDYVKENIDDDREDDRNDGRSRKSRRKRSGPGIPNLASPLRKTAKTGGRVLSRVLNLLLRCGTLILTGYVFYLLLQAFWDNLSAMGDPLKAVEEQNYALASYGGIGLFLLLVLFISFFRILLGSKKDSRNGRPVDSGRGLIPFIFIYAGSWAAALFCLAVPQSPEALAGVRSALLVYGSLCNDLFLPCAAGVILCLIRRFVLR